MTALVSEKSRLSSKLSTQLSTVSTLTRKAIQADLRQRITEEDTRHFWAAALACWWAN